VALIEERVDSLEERADRLEELFGQFMAQSGIALRRIDRAIAEMKAEAARDREEATKERRQMNKRWGELANKMGTLVEDIIAPSLRRMARQEFGCGEERFFAERLSRTRSDDPSRRREFDAFYVGEQAVLINETKSTARPEDAQAFVDFLAGNEFALYFPEYREMPVVPVFSSLHIPPELVTYLTRHGVYAVAMGEEAVQVLNLEQVREQEG
jgi:hypothetical protein